jgi:hypothetical protein
MPSDARQQIAVTFIFKQQHLVTKFNIKGQSGKGIIFFLETC